MTTIHASIAIDIGASSGRVVAGICSNNQLHLHEIARFQNGFVRKDQGDFWDLAQLFDDILKGLTAACTQYTIDSIGVDTWAVDYVLLDADGIPLTDAYAYRDARTNNTMTKVFSHLSKETIYEKTGIQFLPFNTFYQLYEHFHENSALVKEATTLLLIPDYFHYCLSGIKANEFTNATTTQLLNHEQQWEPSFLDVANVPAHIFPPMVHPGTILGCLRDDIKAQIHTTESIQIVVPATHDTASAVVATPLADDHSIYISSGTWSLMGIEVAEPICTPLTQQYNFTNEGGASGTYRLLKNVMGLWMIQEVKRNYGNCYDFPMLVHLAEEASPFSYVVNPNHTSFLKPDNMILAIQHYCQEVYGSAPETPGQISRCIFESLALSYRKVLLELEALTQKTYTTIHIVGGGCQNHFLNQLCANVTQRHVIAGPVEATAMGNLIMQWIGLDKIKDIAQGRTIVQNSVDFTTYTPEAPTELDVIFHKFSLLP